MGTDIYRRTIETYRFNPLVRRQTRMNRLAKFTWNFHPRRMPIYAHVFCYMLFLALVPFLMMFGDVPTALLVLGPFTIPEISLWCQQQEDRKKITQRQSLFWSNRDEFYRQRRIPNYLRRLWDTHLLPPPR